MAVELEEMIRDQSLLNFQTNQQLLLIARSFDKLRIALDNHQELATAPFAEACDHISVLFSLLGAAFGFAGKDYVQKVHDLKGAANKLGTLPLLIDNDVEGGTVRKGGSHSRNLLRIKRGIDCMHLLFKYLLEGSAVNVSLKDCALRGYTEVFGPHHSWTIRKVVSAGMLVLPSKQQFMKKLNEHENSWRQPAEEYVNAARPVIGYIENLFDMRNLGTDW
eukprot:jgi/Mesen1/2541/ME000161S01599